MLSKLKFSPKKLNAPRAAGLKLPAKKCTDKNPNTPYLFSRGRSSRELQAKMSSFLHSPPDEGGGSGGRLPHVVNYRASMLYVTSLCILGVDFPVFPRYFLKIAERIP